MNVIFSESDWDSVSESSEDQEDLDLFFGNRAHSLLSNLEETIGKIDDFLSFERGFLHGDIVCSAADPSGQTGKVVNVEMTVDLESANGRVIRDVNSKKISKIRSICAGDVVVNGHWIGRVDRVIDSVSIIFDDGSKADVIAADQEKIIPTSPDPVDDPQFPYYPGQRVRVNSPALSRQARWLCGSWRTSHEEGTVCAVKAGFVQVKWLWSALSNCGSKLALPEKLQDGESMTVLSGFTHSNWQLGDWCSIPVGAGADGGFRRKDSNPNPEGVFVIARTRTRVDVVWQDGTRSLGVDSQALLPISVVDVHEFWPEQFVLMKGSSEDSQDPITRKWGVVRSMDSKEKTVTVSWKNAVAEKAEELVEETVSAYELIDHPDYSFCLGDIVFRLGPGEADAEADDNDRKDFYSSLIGNVVGFKDGRVEVKWATGVTSKVAPYEIIRCDRYEVPIESPAPLEDTVGQIGQQTDDQDGLSSVLKEKDLSSSRTVNDIERRKFPWGGIPLSLPRSAIGFLTGLTTSLFGSAGSTSEFGSSPACPTPDDIDPPHGPIGEANDDEEALVSEMASSEVEVFPEVEEKRDSFSSEEKGNKMFVQFDLVGDCSDHFFLDRAGKELGSSQVKLAWFKKVQQEWSILEKNLPETIYVRAYEERMDLLRAAIVGAPSTPYHDGLFFFDIYLPPEYPNVPPMVHYHSGGLRLNPNLYESGKVCLSLLNTWAGTGSEVWNPQSSTVLQVLVSLQALVLNDRPYFNEAGYDKQVGKAEGEKNSLSYNENAFLLTCKSMMYLIRKPPTHFEELVSEHFGNRCRSILGACKNYIEGMAPVGFPLEHGVGGEQGNQKGSSTGFKIMLAKLRPKLIETFQEKGFDCSESTDP